jgi:tetratricopeptide (TPR) repeat protein
LVNPGYRGTNATIFNPTNGIVMVARLDGPTAQIARSLVDKAITAERDGLWGRAYFDLRGLTNGDFGAADTNFLTAAEVAQRSGFDTVIDRNPQTFSAAFPMSQIALYAGWYDQDVSGPFTREKVEFMPGAFAYHLHSYNAATLRSTTAHWAGPLLAKGATATMGAVEEPLLGGLPDMSIFFTRWVLLGMTYGESAYSSLAAVSWYATVVGDPLYRPFRKSPQQLHEELSKSGSKLIAWSHLKIVNLNLVMGSPVGEMIQYLQQEPTTKTSAVLTEKLGDLFQMQGKTEQSIAEYRKALDLNPTPQQEVRLRLLIMNKLLTLGKRQEVPAELEQFKKHCPDYPEMNILEQQVKHATSAPRK